MSERTKRAFKEVKDLKNVSGNFLDDDELDGVVGGYDSVVAIGPDSSGQSMQPLHLSSRDDMSGVVEREGSSGNTLVERAKEFCGSVPLEGAYGKQSDLGQDQIFLSDLVAIANTYRNKLI